MRYMGFRRNTINLLYLRFVSFRRQHKQMDFSGLLSGVMANGIRWSVRVCKLQINSVSYAVFVNVAVLCRSYEWFVGRCANWRRKPESNANKTRLMIVNADQSEININSNKLIRCYQCWWVFFFYFVFSYFDFNLVVRDDLEMIVYIIWFGLKSNLTNCCDAI